MSEPEEKNRRSAAPAGHRPGRPSPARRRAALSVMLALALVTVGVLIKQSYFNPAVVASRAGGGAGGAAGDMVAGDMVAGVAGVAGDMEAGMARPEAPIFTPPEGLRPMTPAERFDRNTLSDKINGKAEFYLPAGFARLDAQRFAMEAAPDIWMEAFLYNMEEPANAFSVFSGQRREDAEPVDLSPNAYTAENALFLTHGPYYVEIIATAATVEVHAAMRALAAAFMKAHPQAASASAEEEEEGSGAGSGAAPSARPEEELLPAEGRIADSLIRIPANAFGFAGLDRVYVARYRLGEAEATAFVSRRESPEAAAALAADYADFLKQFGGMEAPGEASIPDMRVIEIMGFYEVILTRGNILAGAHEAPDRDTAIALGRRLGEIR